MRTIKPFLSDKILSTEIITLIYNGEVVATQQDTANVMNSFFSSVVTNLKITEYADYDPIVRYRNHPSIR